MDEIHDCIILAEYFLERSVVAKLAFEGIRKYCFIHTRSDIIIINLYGQ